MSTTKFFVGLLAVLAMSLPLSPVMAEVTRGAMLANSCAGCHGPDGRGSKRIPRLNDLESADIVELMLDFKEGPNGSTIMNRHAPGYTDEEIKLLADHMSKSK